MQLPHARGPLSAVVLSALADGTDLDCDLVRKEVASLRRVADPLGDDDLHLSLWSLYELHYRGFEEVDAAREWDPALIEARRPMEDLFEQRLREHVARPVAEALGSTGQVPEQIEHLIEHAEDSGLTRHVQRFATLEQFREVMAQRSVYTLKESDPSSFVLPRLDGRVKTALAELQYDEYGGGRPDRLHATLFARALSGCGLDPTYGAYVDVAPGPVLALNNAMSLFGLHRRLLGAALGHLTAFEATSSLPCRKVASGVRRLGLPDEVWDYFDEHVEADAVHEQIALRDICAAAVADDPSLHEDVLFGAAVCLQLDAAAGAFTMAAWEAGTTSLWATTAPVSA
jgi:hypothetical protein